MDESVKKLARDLDFSIGAIEVLISTLVDVEIEFGQLVDSITKAVHTGQERVYYHEHYRKIRILTTLLRCTTDGLSRESETTGNIRYAIFDQFVKRECERQ